MNEIEALHNAARQYCIDRYDYWATRYQTMLPRPPVLEYTPRQLDTFPRYIMVDVIREAIESSLPQDFSSLNDLRAYLMSTAREIQTDRTRSQSDIAQRPRQEERDLLCRYVQEATIEQTQRVKPLPCRRSLSEAEGNELRVRRGRSRSSRSCWTKTP